MSNTIMSPEEIAVIDLTNEVRQQYGLQPLQPNNQLALVADLHSSNMIAQDCFSHTGADGTQPADRAESFGYESSFVGENIGAGYTNPSKAVEGWVNSPGHLENILNPNYREIGVGYQFIANDPGEVSYNHYWTQVFGSSLNSNIEEPPPPPPALGTDVHRFWDDLTNSHFFTADNTEKNDLLTNPSRYSYEGIEFKVPTAGSAGALPVYRFENQTTGTYFYTLQQPDLITQNYPVLESDGIAFYAYPSQQSSSGIVPVHRFFNQGSSATSGSPVHFFTGNEANKDNVINNYATFSYEGAG